MSYYKYKKIASGALWNSLFAALNAFVLVVIIFYGWQIFSNVTSKISDSNEGEAKVQGHDDRIKFLEELKSDDLPSDQEQQDLLDQLSSDQPGTTEEDKIKLLDTLGSSENE